MHWPFQQNNDMIIKNNVWLWSRWCLMLAYQRVYKQILQALKDNTYQSGVFFPQSRNWRRYTALAVQQCDVRSRSWLKKDMLKLKQGHGTIVLKSIYPTDAFEYSRLHHFEDILSIRHVNIPNPEQMSARECILIRLRQIGPFLKCLKSRWEQWYTGSTHFLQWR